jgi:hypothetical protein
MIPLAAFEEIIDASGVAPRIEAALPIGVRRRQLSVRTLLALALGGDCLADVAVLRAQPELFGPVASDPVVSRLVASLAADTPRALKPTRAAQAAPQHLRAVKADALSPAENGVHTGGSCGMRNSSRPGVRICR